MKRSCEACGKPFEAKTKKGRFCSATCRSRSHRGGVARVAGAAAKEQAPTSAPSSSLTSLPKAVLTELEQLGKVGTAIGRYAMELAMRISSGEESGSAVASLGRELRAALEVVQATAQTSSQVDELRRKREERLGVGA